MPGRWLQGQGPVRQSRFGRLSGYDQQPPQTQKEIDQVGEDVGEQVARNAEAGQERIEQRLSRLAM